MKRVMAKAVETVNRICEALMTQHRSWRNMEDEPKEEFIRRKMRDLRIQKNRQFETIICQVDRSTGEIVIPRKTRGMIAALRREAEHRLLGWLFAAFLATALVIGCLHDGKPCAESVTFEPRPTVARSVGFANHFARTRVTVETSLAVTNPIRESIAPTPMENVQVGSQFTSQYADGVLVIRGVPIYESRPVAPPIQRTGVTTGKINLNTATADEIDRALPGVGPVLAQAIVAARPYRSVNDLRKVRHIGSRTFELLAPLVAVN